MPKRSGHGWLVLIITFCTAASAALTVREGRLYDNGKLFTMHGINWFGFNNAQTMVDGLWAGKTSLTGDFLTVLYRQQLLGFNAVRLPFSFRDFKLPARQFPWCSQASIDDIRTSVTPPGVDTSKRKLPSPRVPLNSARDGRCNIGMPSDTYQRFLWVIRQYVKAGFKVVIDNHVFLEDPTAYEDPKGWVKAWASLAADLAREPSLRDNVVLDLVNEPDNRKIFWKSYPSLGGRPALTSLYLNAMDAIHMVHPTAIFALEGTGQIVYGIPAGDGFVTNATVIKRFAKKTYCHTQYCMTGIEDPTPFFRALLKRPYAQQVIAAPHFYAQSIIPTRIPPEFIQPPGVYQRMYDSFGYLSKSGYCSGGKCLKWPILVGEFAAPNLGQPGDVGSTDALVNYINQIGASWMYWCW